MRKSLLITLEFPPEKGGTQKYYFNICNNLPSDKIVVLAPRTLNINYKLQITNYKTYRKKLLINWLWPHWLPMIYHLWRIIKKEKIELIQVGQVLPCGTAAMIINKLFKIPYIVYTHGLDILHQPQGSRKNKLIKLILTEAEKVISNSEFTKNEVIKMGIGRDKIEVVYPTIGIQDSIRQLADKIEDLKNKHNLGNKKILLTVCRLVNRKGVDLVIEALNKISNQAQDLVYVVIGDGPASEALKVQSESLENSPVFTGKISDEELSAWYELCDAFILTPKKSESDVEGFGIVYLEANSHGKPVIGGKVGGVAEAIEDGVSGILVEPDNIEEIGQAMVRLFSDDELRAKLGRQGKERAGKEFGVEEQVERLREVLK